MLNVVIFTIGTEASKVICEITFKNIIAAESLLSLMENPIICWRCDYFYD